MDNWTDHCVRPSRYYGDTLTINENGYLKERPIGWDEALTDRDRLARENATLRSQIDEYEDRISDFTREIKKLNETICELRDTRPSVYVTARQICKLVANAHDITLNELMSDRRSHHLVVARAHAMYLIQQHTHLSIPQIGARVGGRDHTTVLHNIRAHLRRVADGKAFPKIEGLDD